ncbi:Transmembrane protein 43 [Seminavis robusta]|uniref:Transmembrane protein 43 n=1 Tax=Seminavis robusta TaxID=568900 RepID=A0A9N8E642_9STRA|nr:Transmembrane protein 43 [Seminavis robusta]|eukprot:Sro712_g191360.1 Transmembrane protein 43 (385) ;mRNA; f:24081-25235
MASQEQVDVSSGESDEGALLLLGLICLLVGMVLWVWSECNWYEVQSSLREGISKVISIRPDIVNPDMDRELVHVKGKLLSESMVYDNLFGIRVRGLKLERSVEMLQWVESEREGKEGESKKYSYSKEWRSKVVDSSKFHQQGYNNPHWMRFEDRTFTADPIKLGAFELPKEIVDLIPWSWGEQFHPELCNIPDEDLQRLARNVGNGSNRAVYIGNYTSPSVGDHRVTFKLIPEQNVSLVAQQTGSSFQKYIGDILLLEQGEMEALAMFESAKDELTGDATALRIGGGVLVLVGLALLDVLGFSGMLVSTAVAVLDLVLFCWRADSFKGTFQKLHHENPKRFLGYESVPPVPAPSPEDAGIDGDILRADPLMPPKASAPPAEFDR